MTTLEEQVRRYAVDVAGPAVAEPPADLFTVGRPRHRGRWVLVGALAVFIAGLTWVATRPTELGEQPSADSVVTPLPLALPTVATPSGTGPCTPDETVTGVLLEGPDGAGLCVAGTSIGGGKALLRVFADGGEIIRARLSSCMDPEAVGYPPFAIELPDGPTIAIGFVRADATYARSGSDPEGKLLAAFDLDGFPDTRIVVARVADPTVPAGLRPLDADGEEQDDMSIATAPTCLANDGSPVTTFPSP